MQYEADAATQCGLQATFVQDNQSLSCRVGTLRGIHLQLSPCEQGKLVRVLRGRIVDVVVDLRPDSSSLGQFELIELDAHSGDQVWVPPGFGRAYCTLETDTEIFYKVDAPYDPGSEQTQAWDDPTLNIEWPFPHGGPILSTKDANGAGFGETIAAIEEAIV